MTATKHTDCLIVVDVQNDFCSNGALAVPDGEAVVPVTNSLMNMFGGVVFTQDWHPAGHNSFASSHPGKKPFDRIQASYGEQILWPDHCIQGSTGAQLHTGLNSNRGELILRKGFRREIDSYSAFFENDRKTMTGLDGYLRERGFSRLFLTGLALDVCVRYTAEDARRLGYETLVVRDACRAIDSDGSLAAALEAMERCGARLIQSDEFELR